MLRLLHVSDLHLDRAFAGIAYSGCDGGERRKLLRRSLEWAVDTALERSADVVTIGGDLFELEHVTTDTVNFIIRQLGRLSCPVVVVSGNHDPARSTSPYRTTSWPGHVTLRLEPRLVPLEVAGAVIWAFGHSSPDMAANPLEGYVAPDDRRTQLLLGHAIDISVASPETGRLGLTPEDVSSRGLHHALLGHIHAGHAGDLTSSPGSPVPLNPAEVRGNHGAIWIEAEGATVKATPIAADLLQFLRVKVDVSTVRDSSQLETSTRAHLLAIPAVENALITCELVGAKNPALHIDHERLGEALRGSARGVRVVDSSTPAVDLKALAAEPNSRGQALAELLGIGSQEALLAARLLVEAFEGDLALPA